MIKSFRGLIANGAIDEISLHTNTGTTGYRIVKFELMMEDPMNVESEHVVKIFTIPQTTVTGTMDFSDNTLLGAAFIEGQPAAKETGSQTTVIFDNMKFNQDIYITHLSEQNVPVNYYVELEVEKLSLDENTVATLKDIRNISRN